MSKKYTIGLKERLSAATTKESIAELLAECETYELASNSTRNAWKNTAKRVRKSLGVTVEELAEPLKVVEATIISKTSRKNKKHKK